MTDDVWRRDEVESPCIKVCVLHPEAGLCIGCLRTGAEIAGWSRMDPQARRAVLAQLPSRRGRVAKRRGGRARRAPEPRGPSGPQG